MQCPCGNRVTGKASHCKLREFNMLDLRWMLIHNFKAFSANKQTVWPFYTVSNYTRKDTTNLPTT